MRNLRLGWDDGKTDERPAVMVEEATVAFSALAAARGDKAEYDVGLRHGAGGTTVVDSPGIVVCNV